MTVEPTDGEPFIARRLRLKLEREQAEREARGEAPWNASETAAGEVSADSSRGQRWIAAKVAAQLEQLSSLQPGERNHSLNAIAFSIGHYVPKWVDGQAIARQLYDAARACGLEHDETVATINSGLRKGALDPRDPPVADDRDSSDPFAGATAPPVSPDAPDPFAEEPDPETLGQKVRRLLPLLDWHMLWADDSEEEWIVEPLLPARRLVALYSAPKMGKSLLMLEIAAAVAGGRAVLGVELDRARRVLYVDFENDPKADVRKRLQAMGYGPGDLENLCYLSFPNLAALDSERGGLELMAALAEYECEVVVVDTVSRAIAGEENENDTWLSFYRHTGLLLKQAGIALIRLDHSGKDETKGQRGGSAKSGDVDAVWRLSRVKDGEEMFRLDCEAARMPVMEKTLVLHRRLGPLRHQVDAAGKSAAFEVAVQALIAALDELEMPDETTVKDAGAELRKGRTVSNVHLAEAVRRRKRRSEWSSERDDE